MPKFATPGTVVTNRDSGRSAQHITGKKGRGPKKAHRVPLPRGMSNSTIKSMMQAYRWVHPTPPNGVGASHPAQFPEYVAWFEKKFGKPYVHEEVRI